MNPAPTPKPVPCSRCGCPFRWGDARGNWWCPDCNPPSNLRQIHRKLELHARFEGGGGEPAGQWVELLVDRPPPPPDPFGPPAGVDLEAWFDALPDPMTPDAFRRAEKLCIPDRESMNAAAARMALPAALVLGEPAGKAVIRKDAAAKSSPPPPAAGKKKAAKKNPSTGTRTMFGVDDRDGVGV